MKYHIAVKFIAIFLCAACLLGAVGSAAGMVVLSELDLYNNTVDEYLDKQFRDNAQEFARQVALYYASTELGGCPEELVSDHYSNRWWNSQYKNWEYGYTILDAEGNVVAGRNTELRESGKDLTSYSFPVTGQYMYMVSQTAVEDENEEPQDPSSPLGEAYGVYDIVPEEGAEVYGISVGFNGSNPAGAGYGSSDSMGVLYHDSGKDPQSITFQPEYNGEAYKDDWFAAGDMNYVSFQGIDGQVLYEASVPQYITWEYTGGSFTFTPSMRGTAPAGTLTEVYLAEFYSLDDPEQTAFVVYGDDPIGEMYCDENGEPVVSIYSVMSGNVKASGAISGGWVSGISLYDANGAVIVESRNPGLVTITEDGVVYYHAAAPGTEMTAPQAAQPAAQAETPEGEPEAAAEPVTEGAPEEVPEETPEEAPEGASDEAADEGEIGPQSEEEGQEGQPEEENQTGPENLPEEGDQTEPESQPVDAEEPEETIPETVATEPTVTEAAAAATLAPSEDIQSSASYEIVETTEPVYINGKALSEYDIQSGSYYDQGVEMVVKYVYTPMPEYTVEFYAVNGPLRYESVYTLLRIVRNFRSDLFLILGVSLLLFAVCVVYLCCAAGHRPRQEEIRAGGLSRMPLDLNLGLSAVAATGLVFAAAGIAGETSLMASVETGCLVVGGSAFLVSLLLVQLMYCAAAQFKTPGGYWWRNSVCGRVLLLTGRLLRWMAVYLPGKVVWLAKFLWNLAARICRFLWRDVLLRIVHGMGNGIRKFMGLLPLMWQWLLVGGLMVLICAITAAGDALFLGIIACLCIVVYMSYCFGVLLKSAKRMSKGNLDTKVDNKHMVGCFEEFAGDLNDLADVAVVAAQKQLKSERMKTELITNVSHDIKTPLTSIINYVDLLQKPHTEEEEAMYLEVLARQSQRLKKLIEDLMDMSKASTGNMNVDITTLDAVEAVNQALGEFADKLDKAGLIPVFRHSQESAMMQADGKLTWRVLSNLLGNAVKYAMPGTRLYIDLMEMEGNVVISLKNISRDELNVDADELMERFVRGDDSRNTEGSGLGLNIAKSLMELQKGQLQLLVDGDLFKVTLIFPGV